MTDSKLIFLLKTFEKAEWRRFREYLASPYFNKRTDLLDFYDCIYRTYPDLAEKTLKKQRVFQTLYPGLPYDDKQMRYLMNYTLQAAENFLGQQKLDALSLRYNYVLEELVERKLPKHSKKYFDKIGTLRPAEGERATEFYFTQYKLADTAIHYQSSRGVRQDHGQLSATTKQLDRFYFYHKLKYSCAMLNRQQLFSTQYDLELADALHQYLSNQELADPLIAIYFRIYALLTQPDKADHFRQLKMLIRNHRAQISVAENQEIFLYAINYCSQRIKYNVDIEYHANEALDLYLEGIREGILLTDGFLSPWNFKNVVKLGINLRRYDFTEQFIQDYHLQLAPAFQADALHYNLADLAYRKGNYDAAQHHLLQVAYSDIFYTLGAKTMLLKIYYENQEIESLFSLIASFSILLRRHKKVSDTYRETYLNFATLLGQVVRTRRDRSDELKKRIQTTELLTNRAWLLEICEKIR